MTTLRIKAVGALTSVGVGAKQTDASLRAGLCRFREGPWSPHDDPVVLALVADEVLAEAQRAARSVGDGWPARIAALAGLALADAVRSDPWPGPDPASESDAPVVLLLGLPDPREAAALPSDPVLFDAVAAVAAHPIDPSRSRAFPTGRAAVFDALAAAREVLSADPRARVVCGAVDSYADGDRVQREADLRRTMGGPWAGNGRVLGEAAGMLVMRTDVQGATGSRVSSLGRHDDPGHRFGTEPARGEGLANAIEALRQEGPPDGPYASVWAGLTGEVHDVKQWGTACLRHRDLFTDDTRVEHPADRIGDAGAGLGALLLVDAHQRLSRGSRPGPALVWAGSDHGAIGCTTVYQERR